MCAVILCVRVSRGIISALTAVILYILLELIFGPAGVLAYQDAHAHMEELEEHLSGLRELEQDLSTRIEGLQRDQEVIRVEARSLGLVEPDERLLRIEGYERQGPPTQAGTAMAELEPYPDYRPLLRGLSAASALLLYIGMLLFDLFRGKQVAARPASAGAESAAAKSQDSRKLASQREWPQNRDVEPAAESGAGVIRRKSGYAGVAVEPRALSDQNPQKPTIDVLGDDVEPIELPGLPYSSASPVHDPERRPFSVVRHAEEQ